MDKMWTNDSLFWEEEASYILEKAAEILGEDFSQKEISLVLANDQKVQSLNHEFRHKNKPTNVLSFPSDEADELGDIILAHETIVREAEEKGISLLHHTLHLIVHGFLHLLGYVHEEENEALHMEAVEIKILKTLNISNPYEDK
ncbi:MAG: rRNA maturation RNase YbeY [Alphaproteobacteria bacterium]|nr:rRNA maturation RNase YbeY [Alphaproteobacteria bacterium]MBP7729812.1 rRNA maturation RNase YbeY [Alphaproteobacteria bacterium]